MISWIAYDRSLEGQQQQPQEEAEEEQEEIEGMEQRAGTYNNLCNLHERNDVVE